MTNGEKMHVSIAIEAAKSCLHVFENEYPPMIVPGRRWKLPRSGSTSQP
jgi:hypothetical protein